MTLAALVLAEIGLRAWTWMYPGYYGRMRYPASGVNVYGYGTIAMNREGFPDREWDTPSEKPRVAYLGDSVTFGVGAGDGHRFTDRLAELRPELDHVNLGRNAYDGPDIGDVRYLRPLLQRYDVDFVVYVMNLNDVAGYRDRPMVGRSPWQAVSSRSLVASTADARVRALWMLWSGGEVHGLFPRKYPRHYAATALRIRDLRMGLPRGVKLAVVLLPGEMQISDEAAAYYRDRLVRFEPGIEEGSPAEVLRATLDPAIPLLDLREAFLERADRAHTPLCAYFVCTDGGALDWNHLDREGHAVLAEALAKSEILRGVSER